MAGVSLINSLREKWCMNLLSRQSGWKEKSQPECTLSVLCGLFLAILSPFVQQIRFLVDLLRDCFFVWLFPIVPLSRTERLDDASRDGREKTPTRWWTATPTALSSELPTPHPTFTVVICHLASNTCPLSQDKILLSVHSVQYTVMSRWLCVQTAASY